MRIFLIAFVSICRMRSRVTLNWSPISFSVRAMPPFRPNRSSIIFRSRSVSPDVCSSFLSLSISSLPNPALETTGVITSPIPGFLFIGKSFLVVVIGEFRDVGSCDAKTSGDNCAHLTPRPVRPIQLLLQVEQRDAVKRIIDAALIIR